jgi:hypothetical protein
MLAVRLSTTEDPKEKEELRRQIAEKFGYLRNGSGEQQQE